MAMIYIFRNLNELADWFDNHAASCRQRATKMKPRSQDYTRALAEASTMELNAMTLRSTGLTGQPAGERLDSAKVINSVSGKGADI